jgi:hypothetical protein
MYKKYPFIIMSLQKKYSSRDTIPSVTIRTVRSIFEPSPAVLTKYSLKYCKLKVTLFCYLSIITAIWRVVGPDELHFLL